MEKVIENIKCTIVKEICNVGNYKTFGCLLDDYEKDIDKIILNKYGNFTISGDLPYLNKGESYTLNLIESIHPKYGIQYKVENVKDYELTQDLENLTVEQSKEILTKFTTDTQANTLLSVYPQFISMVINGKTNEIDVKKLKNIKEYRLNCYIKEINTRFKYYYILIQFKEYNLSIKECQELDTLYGSVDKVEETIEKYPYTVLIDILHRDFSHVDKLIMKIRPEMKESVDRIEHIALYILTLNEEDNNTYMNANEMASFCAEIDKDCIKHIKKICVESQKIWYDDESKRIAKMDTYMAEFTIANFFANLIIDKNCKWDYDWKKYTEIKNGILTDEQSELLHAICENRVVILNAGGGTGKTSSIMALITMLEDNNHTYTLLAPTGRAAKRMTEQTHRKASTVHKACNNTDGIDSDVIICDEFSMWGLEHMMMVLKTCTNSNVKFVFSGDIHQLPSIALGCIMRDFIKSNIIPIITLTKVFRYKEGGMATFIKDVYDKKNNFTQPIRNCLKFSNKCVLGNNKDYTFIESNGTLDQIVDIYMSKINSSDKPNPIDIAVITPWNVKDFGTYKINNAIQSVINPAKKNERIVERKVKECTITFRKGDIVMNTQNNYNVPTYEAYKQLIEETGEIDLSLIDKTVGVFNGDVGKILDIDENNVVIIQFDENIVVFKDNECNNLVLGYAGTIHKYQGSQCPHIILLTLKCHEKSYNNNLLYTGLSRASTEVTQIGDLAVMENCISVDGNENRETQLGEFLIDEYKEKING